MWAPHDVPSWYLGPAIEHYRCHQVYVTNTRGGQVIDVVEFVPSRVSIPHPSSIETATKAALGLIQVLRNPSPETPFSKYGDTQLRQII